MTQTISKDIDDVFAYSDSLFEGRLLRNKVALITGSNKGIGETTAHLFAVHGAKVIVNGRNEKDCRRVRNDIEAFGGDATAIPADITNAEDVERMMKEVINTHNTIDVLVNNAGTSRDGLVHKIDDWELDVIMDINLKGAHLCTKAVLPYFKQDSRHNDFKKIVNVSSITGISGNFGQSNYGISKGGLISYSKACARELARDRINVNVVAPGFTETQMTAVKSEGNELGMPEPIRNLAIASTPFARNGHAGKTVHMASGILFFASNFSDWITGNILLIDGGMYI